MDISILFATYKRSDILRRTLDGFTKLDTNGLTWEVLVVDNAADKETKQLVEEFANQIPVVYIEQPIQGKNLALNKGIELLKGDIVIVTDDDIIADKNWLHEIKAGFDRWPNHCIFGGRILPDWPNAQKSSFTFLEENFLASAYAIADWDIEEGEYDPGKVWGPNMAVRKKIFDEGHRFNPDMGPASKNYLMGSETEFTKRMEQEGYPSIYLPKALVYHQIREEQLTAQWMYGRAFRSGRADTEDDEQINSAHLFGAPRYLYGLFLKAWFKQFLKFNKEERIKLGVEKAMIKGRIFQFRLRNKKR